MRWHHRLFVALRGWFQSSTLDAELGEELRFHFDREVQANIERGLTPEQARRAATIAIGNPEPIREASRDLRAGASIRQLARDVGFGVRLVRKAPAFSICAVAIIAAGIGSVTAIFSVVYGVLLRPLPFPEPERLVQIWTHTPRYARDAVSAADRVDWQAGTTAFEGIALYNGYANFNLTDGAGEPERLLAARISANSFSVLQVAPRIGRGFVTGEDQVGHERVVVLSDALWRRRFGADPAIVGRDIRLSGIPHEVVGIMGPDFPFPERPFDLWVPLTVNPKELTREVPPFGLRCVARLKRGSSIEEAQSQLSVVAARLAGRYAMNKDVGVEVVGLRASLVGDVRRALLLIMAAVAALLLVASLNLAALLSARAASRVQETAVRFALGASRQRVLLQAIAELIPLLVIGAAIGIAAATVAVNQFLPVAPAALPRLDSIAIDRVSVLVSVAVLAIAGSIAAVLPAMHAWRADLASVSRDSSRGASDGPRHSRTRHVLVVMQIALSLPLLTGAVLLARSFAAVAAVDPGFNPDPVVSMHLAIPRSKYQGDSQVAQFEARILERIQAVPGVKSAAFVNRLPLFGIAQNVQVNVDTDPETSLLYGRRVIAADYFNTMGIPIVEGRTFAASDTVDSPTVAIVDERVAQQRWPGQSAIGKRIRFSSRGAGEASGWMAVVGVVGHVKHDGLDVDSLGEIYFDYRQQTQDRAVIVAKVEANPTAVMTSIRSAIREVDPDQPVYDMRTLNDVLSRSITSRRLSLALVSVFASIALFLCAIGVYGVIAFGVTRQRREIGIRLALGATRGTITSRIIGRGLTLAGLGITAGLLVAIVVARSMTSVLYSVGAGDLASYAGAVMVIAVTALIASYLPARRAASVDPASTLRAE